MSSVLEEDLRESLETRGFGLGRATLKDSNGLVVKDNGCSSSSPGTSKPPITPVLGEWMPSSGTVGGGQAHEANTHFTYKNNFKVKKKKVGRGGTHF